ncbi:hypothetical protein [Pseudomonas syringae]|uniref:hypothetical protein n=1 Tax=Pseudomonas syringae TaxID=317 RepID=UPI0004235B8A|nr:hypothetical protein [Pseudomonas syringae]
MQELAKYSFKSELPDVASAITRFEDVCRMVDSWLESKAPESEIGEKGKFNSSRPGVSGYYTRKVVINDLGQLRDLFLVELVRDEHVFSTSLRVGLVGERVIVYCVLSVDRLSDVIAPVRVFPRCPKIIRDVIATFGGWDLDGDLVPGSQVRLVTGEVEGASLSALLLDRQRKFPVIVVSDDPDESPWSDVAERLANDLVGVAHVAKVDEPASWALTDELGKINSCYLGAVRLYWPVVTEGLNTSVWTAKRLVDQFGDGAPGLNRYLTMVRETVLEISSLSLSTPKTLREIAKQDMRHRISSANKADQESQLDTIIDENSDLSERLDEAQAEIARLNSKIASLHSQLGAQKQVEVIDDSEPEVMHVPAVEGELRYYKKIGKKADSDILVVTKSCTHNNWRSTPKAIQAGKGVQNLEGSSNWRSFMHCNRCTGGGRWKVQW